MVVYGAVVRRQVFFQSGVKGSDRTSDVEMLAGVTGDLVDAVLSLAHVVLEWAFVKLALFVALWFLEGGT